jgi:hypothetical protein
MTPITTATTVDVDGNDTRGRSLLTMPMMAQTMPMMALSTTDNDNDGANHGQR